MRVLVVGDACLDFTRFVTIERASPEACRCPIVRELHHTWSLGGAANVAAWLAADPRLTVTLMAPHGNDDAGIRLASLCVETGVMVSRRLFDPDLSVTTKERLLVERPEEKRVQHLLRVDADALGEITEHDLLTIGRDLQMTTGRLAHKRYDAIVAVDYDKFVFRGETGERLVSLLATSGLPVFVNAKHPGRWGLEPITLLVSNQEEMVHDFGYHDARKLRDQVKASHLVVTRSAGGVTSISYGGDPIHRLTLATDVVDVCGAGDAFTAGIVRQALLGNIAHLGRIKPVELVDILDFGQRCAAWCCSQVGVGTPLVGEER